MRFFLNFKLLLRFRCVFFFLPRCELLLFVLLLSCQQLHSYFMWENQLFSFGLNKVYCQRYNTPTGFISSRFFRRFLISWLFIFWIENINSEKHIFSFMFYIDFFSNFTYSFLRSYPKRCQNGLIFKNSEYFSCLEHWSFTIC